MNPFQGHVQVKQGWISYPESQTQGGIRGKGGGGCTPYNGLYGEAPPEKGTFFRLQVYEKVGKSAMRVFERAQMANRWILWVYEVETI